MSAHQTSSPAAEAGDPPPVPEATRPVRARRLPPLRRGLLVPAALPIAVGLWIASLPRVNVDAMGDLGLLQVLPVTYFAALGLLAVGFLAVLREPRVRQPWAAGYVLALITVIHATPSALYPALRYAWAWKHVAVVDAMLRHDGAVPHSGTLDIYNQWPGFFQLNAAVLRVTGLHSVLGFASWYPLLANLLLVGPLLLLYRSVTTDRRLVWGGVWLYFSVSWVGQDYFSPQAFAHLLYVTVLALVLRRLADRRRAAAAGTPSARRPGAFVLVVVLIAAIVCSHQLTPLMLITTLLLLAIPRRNRRVVLPVLGVAVGLTFLWDSTVARPYVSTHLSDLIGALATPDRNATSGLAGLGSAAPGQVFASWVDRSLTATVFLLALVAVVRHRWVRRTGLPLMLLAPLVMLPSNNYGGEMIFRVYLFALPAAAFLVATLLVPPWPHRRWRAYASGLVAAVLLGGLLFGYYAKENMNRFTAEEAAATRFVTSVAPPGSRIVSVTSSLPGGELGYDTHERLVLAQDPLDQRRLLLTDPLAVLQSTMDDPRITGPTYVILTRAQEAESRLTGVFPVGTVGSVRAALDTSTLFQRLYDGPDAAVYRYIGPGARPSPPGSVQP
ncbi:glycosyltransferase [Kitasatospora sp. NBC_01539]|uniref:glycosyltransferase n=1 Tax=Kitasatospora sp. NBC_01539 TaxID=2903577 RepID=UPI0038600C64